MIDDGGQAFPTAAYGSDRVEGLSKREFYAACEETLPPDMPKKSTGDEQADLLAEWRFKVADAMVKESRNEP